MPKRRLKASLQPTMVNLSWTCWNRSTSLLVDRNVQYMESYATICNTCTFKTRNGFCEQHPKTVLVNLGWSSVFGKSLIETAGFDYFRWIFTSPRMVAIAYPRRLLKDTFIVTNNDLLYLGNYLMIEIIITGCFIEIVFFLTIRLLIGSWCRISCWYIIDGFHHILL